MSASEQTTSQYTQPLAESHILFSKRTFGPVDLDQAYSPEGKRAASASDGSHRTLARWQSEKTGLRVVHVDTGGPVVSLYAAVATEIFNDAGIVRVHAPVVLPP